MSILLVELIFSSEAESASVAVTPMGLHVILQVISQTTQGLEKRLGLLRAAVRPVACLFLDHCWAICSRRSLVSKGIDNLRLTGFHPDAPGERNFCEVSNHIL